MREWTALFTASHPLYEETANEENPEEEADPQPPPVDEEKQILLNEEDFTEYKVTTYLCCFNLLV